MVVFLISGNNYKLQLFHWIHRDYANHIPFFLINGLRLVLRIFPQGLLSLGHMGFCFWCKLSEVSHYQYNIQCINFQLHSYQSKDHRKESKHGRLQVVEPNIVNLCFLQNLGSMSNLAILILLLVLPKLY
jgi:hypothetical protein